MSSIVIILDLLLKRRQNIKITKCHTIINTEHITWRSFKGRYQLGIRRLTPNKIEPYFATYSF